MNPPFDRAFSIDPVEELSHVPLNRVPVVDLTPTRVAVISKECEITLKLK